MRLDPTFVEKQVQIASLLGATLDELYDGSIKISLLNVSSQINKIFRF